jgi:hypothetical protein
MVLFSNDQITRSPFFATKRIIPQVLVIFEYAYEFSAKIHTSTYLLNLLYLKDGNIGFDVSQEVTVPGQDISQQIQESFAD